LRKCLSRKSAFADDDDDDDKDDVAEDAEAIKEKGERMRKRELRSQTFPLDERTKCTFFIVLFSRANCIRSLKSSLRMVARNHLRSWKRKKGETQRQVIRVRTTRDKENQDRRKAGERKTDDREEMEHDERGRDGVKLPIGHGVRHKRR